MKLTYVLAALIGIGLAIGLLGLLGFRFNLTASLPLGIYRVTSARPEVGSVVRVCLPSRVAEFARERDYLGPGSCPGRVRPLGKVVLAVGGDLVTLAPDVIRLNGTVVPNSRTVSRDGRERAVPHYPWGDHRIRPEELWVFSPYHRNAYDSRYFGPVHTSYVVSVLRPLWTWRRGGLGDDRRWRRVRSRNGSRIREGGGTDDRPLILGHPLASIGRAGMLCHP